MRRSNTHDAIPTWAIAGVVLALMLLMVMLSSRRVVTTHRLSGPVSEDTSMAAACQAVLRERLGPEDRRRFEPRANADRRDVGGGHVRLRAVPDGPGAPVRADATEYDCHTERRDGRYTVTSLVRRR